MYIHQQITPITQKFAQSFGNLNQDQLNWKPDANTWSIAQNIDHLLVINESYFPVIEALRDGTYETPFVAKFGFVVSFMGNAILKSVRPDRKKKMRTFPVWEPTQSEISANILDRFNTHQIELENMMEDARDLVEQGVVISSPANQNIVYKLEKAFEIIVNHELRHFEQASEVLDLMTS